MRLIDADALLQKRAHAKAYSGEMYVIGQGYIMDAPTVMDSKQFTDIARLTAENAAYKATGLTPEEIMPLATLMRKFGHGGKDSTVLVGDAETDQVIINGRVYSVVDLMNAVEANAAMRSELDKAREAAMKALQAIRRTDAQLSLCHRAVDIERETINALRQLAGEVEK